MERHRPTAMIDVPVDGVEFHARPRHERGDDVALARASDVPVAAEARPSLRATAFGHAGHDFGARCIHRSSTRVSPKSQSTTSGGTQGIVALAIRTD